jgi:hypothetical protein
MILNHLSNTNSQVLDYTLQTGSLPNKIPNSIYVMIQRMDAFYYRLDHCQIEFQLLMYLLPVKTKDTRNKAFKYDMLSF